MKWLILLFALPCAGQYQGPSSFPNLSNFTWVQPQGATLIQGGSGNAGNIPADQAAVAVAQSTYAIDQSTLTAAQAALAVAQSNVTAAQAALTLAQNQLTLDSSPASPPVLAFQDAGDGHEMMLCTQLPAPPYTVTMGDSINQTNFAEQVSATIMLRNSATDQAVIITDENEAAVTGWNQNCCKIVAGAYLGKLLGVNPACPGSLCTPLFALYPLNPSQRGWIRIQDNGMNRIYSHSQADGFAWQQAYSEPTGSHITPDQACISGYSLNSQPFNFWLTIWQFSITTP